MLEIGTGWGELALRAAQRGARVTSITLSEQQRELALQRIADAGVADRVDIQLCDYRNATGTYDAVVSVEMIEAVGYEFWPIYFRTLDERLRPGGRVGLQAITMARRPDAGGPRHLHLDPEVHLPGRPDPVGGGDRGAPSPATPG